MKKDLTNQKFGKLTAIKSLDRKGPKRCFYWECLCDCGNTTKVEVNNLIRGNNKSCGCLRLRRLDLNPTWKGTGQISGQRFYNYKKNARRRNLEFKVSIQQLWELFLKQGGKCKLTGDVLCFIINSENLASLDRIDSSKGYVIDNLRWIRNDVNHLKNNISDEDFHKICRKVSDFERKILPFMEIGCKSHSSQIWAG